MIEVIVALRDIIVVGLGNVTAKSIEDAWGARQPLAEAVLVLLDLLCLSFWMDSSREERTGAESSLSLLLLLLLFVVAVRV